MAKANSAVPAQASRMMNEFVATQQARLKNEKLDSQARQLIEQRIAEVQRARADLEHSIVAITRRLLNNIPGAGSDFRAANNRFVV